MVWVRAGAVKSYLCTKYELYSAKRNSALIWASLNMKMRKSGKCEFLRINSEVGRSILDFLPIYFDYSHAEQSECYSLHYAYMQNRCWSLNRTNSGKQYKQKCLRFANKQNIHTSDPINASNGWNNDVAIVALGRIKTSTVWKTIDRTESSCTWHTPAGCETESEILVQNLNNFELPMANGLGHMLPTLDTHAKAFPFVKRRIIFL